MSENQLPGEPETVETSFKRTTSLNKKTVGILAAVGIFLVAVLGISAIQTNSRYNSLVSSVNNLVDQDALADAQDVLRDSREEFGDKSEFQELDNEVSQLIRSKSSFETAERLFSENRYLESLSFYERVIDTDEKRFAQAEFKFKESSRLAVQDAIKSAEKLKAKKQYSEALSVISGVSKYASGSEYFDELRSEVSELASEQAKKEEAARNAKYVSALRSMRTNKDSFNNIIFYKDRSTPYYANYSTFHLYIGKSPNSDPYLRFVVRYSDDDWLFVDNAEINIDGSRFDLDVSSSEWETDNGSGDIWEWIDIVPTDYHLELIEKIIDSRSAVIRFYGSQYRDDRTISVSQKRGLRNVLNAYEALKRGLN